VGPAGLEPQIVGRSRDRAGPDQAILASRLCSVSYARATNRWLSGIAGPTIVAMESPAHFCGFGIVGPAIVGLSTASLTTHFVPV